MGPRLRLLTANGTDIGREREENQDYYGFYEGTPYGYLWAVCDGMGGAAGGKKASIMAVELIRDTFHEEDHENIEEVIRTSVTRANKAIFERSLEEPVLHGMGTTAVILVIKNTQAYIAHVGDSRIYLVREGQMQQLTTDHSLVQGLVEEGTLTKEQAKDHPQSHIITRSIGVMEKVDCDIRSTPIELKPDDRFILCSDGLTGMVSEEVIREFALEFGPRQACKKLIDLANKNGGTDNITVQIIKILPPLPPPRSFPERLLKRAKSFSKKQYLLLVLCGAIITIATGLGWWFWPEAEQEAAMENHAISDEVISEGRADEDPGERVEDSGERVEDSEERVEDSGERIEDSKEKGEDSGEKTGSDLE
ncbi:MAG: Stp1/IreP family PP2C-type Ser/Thr phosphatase [Chloroflexi bacterium]|nr:Stp1/IreP family PP2C-type Ser/Thr phosphatase [Chloroflexota bacterium]